MSVVVSRSLGCTDPCTPCIDVVPTVRKRASDMEKLVGRDEELAAIAAFLEAPVFPGAAVLHGEAGIGKTSLWLAGIDAAVAKGFRVLSARPSDAETGLAFSGLSDLLGSAVDAVLPELPPIQRRALEAALLLGEARYDLDERAIAAAFHAALQDLAAARPVCLAVDDVQWLDAGSLGVLRFALARLGDARVTTLLAVRGAPPDWLRRAVLEERLCEIPVEGLTLGATHELLRGRLDVALPRPTVIRIWETSRGNPFFAIQLGVALQRRGGILAPGEDLPISTNLDELLQQRLAGLSRTGLEVVRIVAALADPTTAVVETLVGARFEAALGELLDARVLELDAERLRFTHPLLGSAASARQTPTSRRALHARLAEVAPTSEERARHLALASSAPNREIAATLEDAVRSARARGATFAAARLAEQSLRLTPDADRVDVRRRRFLAAELHGVMGDDDRARALLEIARVESAPGVERAEALVKLADPAGGVWEERRGPEALFEQALVEARGDDLFESRILLRLSNLQRWAEGVERGAALAEQALRGARRTGDVALLANALAERASWQLRAGLGLPSQQVEDALALERMLPDRPLVDGPSEAIPNDLMWIVELDSARTLLVETRDILRRRDDTPREAALLWSLAMVEWRAGNWDEAERSIGESILLLAQLGRETVAADFPAAILAAHRGRVDEARALAERGIAHGEALEVGVTKSFYLGVLGFLELSLGDAEKALGYLRRAYEIRNVFMRDPAQHVELGDHLEALISVGELDEAEALIALWEERSRRLDRAWALAILARARGLLLSARGDVEGALAAFEQALVEHDRTTDPFQRARTLLARGRTQRRAKKRAAAHATLEDARTQFERLDAPLWIEQTRVELSRIGGRAPSRDDLTEAERRIAALVAEGRTNREVAAALFLTVRSVETALTRIYRKLGVRSRSELAKRYATNT